MLDGLFQHPHKTVFAVKDFVGTTHYRRDSAITPSQYNQANVFILSTYVDNERWPSAIDPLLYPTGLSFYRSFSYKTDYFLPDGLSVEFANPESAKKLIANPNWNNGWFGIRFSSASDAAFLKSFVPLRKITLLAAQSLDGINISFRLGPYVVPTPSAPGMKAELPRLDLSAFQNDLSKTKLFLNIDDEKVASTWKVSDSLPDGFWYALERQLSPTALEKLSNTLVLRLGGMRKRGAKDLLSPVLVDVDSSVWGYELVQGDGYDLALSHHRFKPAVGKPAAIEHQFRIMNPTDEINASRRQISLLGNYRADKLWVSPLVPGVGPVEIAIEPRKLTNPDNVVDSATDKIIGLRIPILVKAKKWSRKKYANLVVAIGGAIITCYLLAKYFNTTTTDDGKKLFLALIAIFASLCLNAFKDLFFPEK